MQRGAQTIIDRLNGFAARRPGLASCLLGALFFAFLLLTMRRDVELFDEGIILTNAMRVLDGEVLHRDFYTNYGPGSAYLVAGLFALFGEHLLVARLCGLAAMAVPVGLVFYLLLREVPPLWALIASGASAMVIYASPFYLYPVYPCLALILASAAAVLREGALQRTGALLLAGGLAGAVALFRYDTGFFLLLTLCLNAILMMVRGGRWQAAIRPVMLLGIGAGAAFAPFAIWFLANAPVSAFWTDIIELSAPYAPYRGLPFPGLAEIIDRPGQAMIYLPFVAGLAMLAEWLRGRKAVNAFAILFALLTVILIYKGLVRTSVVHMLLAIIPGIALAAFLAARWWERAGGWRLAGGLLLGFAVLSAASLALPRLRADAGAFERTLAGGLLLPGQPADACIPGDPPLVGLLPPDHARISDYLKRRVPARERILVALDRHDKVFVNPITLYFTSGHLPATRWAQFDPGVQTTAPIQQAMIAELAANDTSWIVRDASFGAVAEPNLSAVSSGVFLLDHYLERHYRAVISSGQVSLWLRNDVARPSAGPETCLVTTAQTG